MPSFALSPQPARSPIGLHLAAMCLASLLSASAQAAPVLGQGTWESTLQARDLNGDGLADAYYDTQLNISWLASPSS